MPTCDICFDDVTKVFSKLCGSDCEGVVCSECLSAHVTSIDSDSFDGSATAIKCIFHPKHVLPYATWEQVADDKIKEAQHRRAKAMLSLQCGGCHSR